MRPVRANSGGGFSLVEMLITLALILIMLSIFSSRFSRSRQQRDLLNCSKNLQNIYSALAIYTSENDGKYPTATNAHSSEEALSILVPRCTTDTSIFICPGTKDKPLAQGKPFADRKISYVYYMGWTTQARTDAPLISDRQENSNQKKTGEQLFSADGKTPGSNHTKYGGNVMFLNGEVRKSSPRAAFDLLHPPEITLLNPRS